MRRPSMLLGALLGGLTSLPLIALFYLGEQWADLPFVPFDLFDWLARVLPGAVVRLGIDLMVQLIGLLGLGSTSEAAKTLEQLQGIVLVVLGGAAVGALLAWLLRRGVGPGWRLGALLGGVVWFLVIVVELALGSDRAGAFALLWLALLIVGWGVLLGLFLDRRPAAEPAEGRAGRRAALAWVAGGSLAVALAAWGLGRLFRAGRQQTGAGRPLAETDLEIPPATPPPTPAGRIAPVPGTRAELTPNGEFYRIDINTRPVTIDGATWVLETGGLLNRPRPLAFRDLTAFEAVTQPVTMSCISNPVGGDLIGTAYWTGVRLRDVVADLGLQSGAQALLIKAADGFFESVSLQDVMDERTLLVYAMNGETLPSRHGFPLRIYIANRYGMKQPKWVVSMVATADLQPGYWVERGWSAEARPQIVSVVDTVQVDNQVDGRLPIGGIAWAGDRGISRVQVQIDDRPWEDATLREPTLSPLTWVQWRYEWQGVPGRHTARVRAVDGTGAEQPAEVRDVFPDGATGYHSRDFTL